MRVRRGLHIGQKGLDFGPHHLPGRRDALGRWLVEARLSPRASIIATVPHLIAAVTAGVLALSSGSGAPAGRVGSIRESSLGSSTLIYLFGLAPGPDGNMWFADLGCAGLGRCTLVRITPDGRFTAFRHGLYAGSVPFDIAAGSDGNLWFTDEGSTPAIGRITPAGHITEFSRGLNPGSEPFEIVAGPHGDLWFTDQGRTPAIGQITADGRITEFSRGLRAGSVPFGIAAGPRRELLFTDRGCSATGSCALGRVTARGRITEFSAGLRRGSDPLGIAAGLRGDVWFADASGAIGRVTRSGRISELSTGLNPGSSPVGIGAGPDGNVWFTDEGATSAIGRITPRGRISEFSAGLEAGSEPGLIAPAPDGELWFTDEGSAAAVGQLATGAPRALKAQPSVVGSPQLGSPVSCRADWAAWAGIKPSVRLSRFDGYQWLRDGVPIAGQRSARYIPAARDEGRRLSCKVTVTYPEPFLLTASATSAVVTVRTTGSSGNWTKSG